MHIKMHTFRFFSGYLIPNQLNIVGIITVYVSASPLLSIAYPRVKPSVGENPNSSVTNRAISSGLYKIIPSHPFNVPEILCWRNEDSVVVGYNGDTCATAIWVAAALQEGCDAHVMLRMDQAEHRWTKPKLSNWTVWTVFKNCSTQISRWVCITDSFLICHLSLGGHPSPTLLHLPLCCSHHWCLHLKVSTNIQTVCYPQYDFNWLDLQQQCYHVWLHTVL